MRSFVPSTSKRLARAIHHALFHESRQGRALEVAAWSNAASAVAVAGGVTAIGWSNLPVNSAWVGLLPGALTFIGLRLALANRFTVWIAATFGTLTVAAVGGGLAWLFGHVFEGAAAPSIATVAGAVLAAVLPAWSYAHVAGRRADGVRDSLVEPPLSAPRSRRSSAP